MGTVALGSKKSVVSSTSSIKIEEVSAATFNAQKRFLVPVLAVKASPQLLSARKIQFDRDEDDLDSFKVARFKVAGVLAILQAYDHSEPKRLNLYVDTMTSKSLQIPEEETAQQLLEALRLNTVEVPWVNPVFANKPLP